jgi:hypothetical protein
MRVLLSALALTALLLLAGTASVLAADGAPPGDVAVSIDPTQPTPTPNPDTTGSAVETMTQTGEPATQPVVEAAAPVIAALADTAAPVAGPLGDSVEPIVDPVIDVVAPVAAPVVDAIAPAAGVLDAVVSPIADALAPVVQPMLDVVDPVIGPIVDVVDPIVDPGTDPVPPVTDPGVGGVDADRLAGVPAPAFDPNTGIARAETSAPIHGSPGDLPWQGAPFGLPSGSAGPGGALTLGASIALLTAGLLAIVFYAFRRPWSAVPTLRGRSLLPALRPA